jgi:hypothetical protein
VSKWSWAFKKFKTTATNKLWGKVRGRAGGVCGDEWFYYQFFVASSEERRTMRKVWNAGLGWVEALLRGSGRGEGGEGGRGQEGCPLMEVVSVEGLLKGLFGVGWEVPTGSVHIGQ